VDNVNVDATKSVILSGSVCPRQHLLIQSYNLGSVVVEIFLTIHAAIRKLTAESNSRNVPNITATIALTRKILVVAWAMLREESDYAPGRLLPERRIAVAKPPITGFEGNV
jgi:hypothetical protein